MLEIPDTDTEQYAPVEAKKELLEDEKIAKGEDKPSEHVADIMTKKFKEDAKEYLQTANTSQEESYDLTEGDSVKPNAKTDSEIATIIASAAPLPRSKPKKPKRPPIVKVTKKKRPPKIKKMTQFRIFKKKK